MSPGLEDIAYFTTEVLLSGACLLVMAHHFRRLYPKGTEGQGANHWLLCGVLWLTPEQRHLGSNQIRKARTIRQWPRRSPKARAKCDHLTFVCVVMSNTGTEHHRDLTGTPESDTSTDGYSVTQYHWEVGWTRSVPKDRTSPGSNRNPWERYDGSMKKTEGHLSSGIGCWLVNVGDLTGPTESGYDGRWWSTEDQVENPLARAWDAMRGRPERPFDPHLTADPLDRCRDASNSLVDHSFA